MSAYTGGGAMDGVDGEALDWALRMAEDDADWDAFTAWLEADAGRAARYDEAVLALDAVTNAIPAHAPADTADTLAANDSGAAPYAAIGGSRGRRGWLGGAIAAVLIGGIGLGMWSQRDERYTVATRPGEQRTVALADGSSIVLAGGSRVLLDGADPRSATIEAGEMLFRVRHDERAPFRVRARGLTLFDLGTVFDVRLTGASTRVAVAEGAVKVDGAGRSVRLDPGQAAVFDGATIRRERQPIDEIGVWREGLLIFSDATMSDVAEALTRNLGVRVSVAPRFRARPFNGTLEVAALRDDPALLGKLLDADVRREGDGWTLDARR
jgi:transmembrane sensor